jgi:redox-sensitive bicupin YhaK (pirin superfamily)
MKARVLDSHWAEVTDTLRVRRALPDAGAQSVGPWVFLDHFGPLPVPEGDEGTPPHPHAGIETVTYLFDGSMNHRDSAGHEGLVGGGGVQWMTAGRGIVHAERPSPGALHGLQLWTSLPRAQKRREPMYQHFDADALPVFEKDGVKVRVVGGTLGGVTSPAQNSSPTLLAHAAFGKRAKLALDVPPEFEVAVYVAAGNATVSGLAVATGQMIVLEPGETRLSIEAADADLVVLGGAPADKPLIFHGPFVLDSAEAVRQAERDYFEGRMGVLQP